jgi:hypothetical protein
MTNTTTPAESTGSPTGAASFYRWEVAGKPIAILFSLDLMDRLEREVLESFKAVTKRGSEIGGVLGGRVLAGSQTTVIIERFEPVECDYSRGPLYLLSDEDKVRMKQAIERTGNAGGSISVAGFFRSNTRRELVLDEEDQAVAKEFFSDPNNVFLLVRPFAMKPSAGGFFFWENGQLPETSYQEFPFKRAELVKNFSQFIVAAPEAPVVREPLVMPKGEERPAAPPVTFKREEPAPAPTPPVVRREEPQAAPVVVPPKREEAPPVSYPREAPPPALVPKEEERPAEPVATEKPEERPPVVVKREEKPVAPPVVARREEPAPAKPEEKPVAAGPAEAVVAAPPLKREEPAEVEPVAAEPPKAQPAKAEPAKAATPTVAAPVGTVLFAAEQKSGPSLFSRLVVLLLLLLAAGGGYYFFVQSRGPAAPDRVADTSLGLKLEASAGQLLLTWNRNAPLVLAATRATLTIRDGDHTEDVDLDLATLSNGRILYSALSNDVRFRLEVADQKTGKSKVESVRRVRGPVGTPNSIPPAPAARSGGYAREATLLERFPGIYPSSAAASHVVGVVRVRALIGKNGKVKKATALSGPQILRPAAVDSVMKWVFSPATVDGKPAESETLVDINFQL